MDVRITHFLPASPEDVFDVYTESGFDEIGVRDFFTNEVWVGAFARIEAYLRSEG